MLIIIEIALFTCLSTVIRYKHDERRLDSVKARRRKKCNDEAYADFSTDCNLCILCDGMHVNCDHYFFLFWPIVQTFNKSHGSRQTVSSANILFLRHR